MSTKTPKDFELIVFDWDGTLMDSTAVIINSLQNAAKDLNLPVPDKKRASHIIGLGLREAFEIAMPDVGPEYYPQLIEGYRYHFFKQSQKMTLFEGIKPLLDTLKDRNYLLAVATGKSRHGLNQALEETGLVGYFETTRTVDESFSKPHPAMLEEIMEELQVPRERTLMVGDTTHDLQMAANAGVASLAVDYGAHPRSLLETYSPIYIASSVDELSHWFHKAS